MKNTFVFLCTVLCALAGSAQLLNSSFESNSAWPSSIGQYDVVSGWSNAGSESADPDYFHLLGTTACDLPETPVAFVQPRTGEAIMGFVACGTKFTEQREYISTSFQNPLVVGKKYKVGFYLTNGIKTSVSTAGLAVDNIGLFFSTSPAVQDGTSPIFATPQLSISQVFYSRDWVKCEFEFTVDQPYKYLTLGLFGGDADKNITVEEGDNASFAYYFVDDFFMIPEGEPDRPVLDPAGKLPPSLVVNNDASRVPAFQIPNSFTPDGDGVNDVFIPVPATIQTWKFSIFNRWGELVFSTNNPQEGWTGHYQSGPAEGGTYVWEVAYTTVSEADLPIQKSEKGLVTLIR
jgi:gliding motility-associated-like protein